MSKGDTFENDFLRLIFNAVSIAGLATADISTPTLYFGLHATNPGEAGSQTTGEISYTSYARAGVTRNGTGGFTVTNNQVSLAANCDFPKCTGGSATAYFWSLGTASSGAGKVLYYGVLGSVLGFGTALVTDTITIPGLTGVVVDDRIVVFAPPGTTIPTGLTEGTVYWVKTVSGNDITLSTTQGGAVVDITVAGSLLAFKIAGSGATAGMVVTTNTIPRLETGTTITEN